MNRIRLQEYCQKVSCPMPVYATTKIGPDHAPKFSGTVTVFGVEFDTPFVCHSAREAREEAAKLAVNQIIGPYADQPESSRARQQPNVNDLYVDEAESDQHSDAEQPSPYFQGQRQNVVRYLQEPEWAQNPVAERPASSFECMEKKVEDDFSEIVKELRDAEAAENTRHVKEIVKINKRYQQRLASLCYENANWRGDFRRCQKGSRRV